MTSTRPRLPILLLAAFGVLTATFATNPRPAAAQSCTASSGADPAWCLYLPLAARGAVPLHEVRTVILTDLRTVSRLFDLPVDGAELGLWKRRLERLAAQREVAGVVILDLAADTDPQVDKAYSAWLANQDPTQINLKANGVATALRDWIWRQRATVWPDLRYIVIAGDDRVVPFFRLRVDPPAAGREDWATEPQYFDDGSLGAASTVGAALAADLTPNDDFYATPTQIPWTDGAARLPVPELAIGRLVERPSDMTAVIDAYLSRPRLTIDSTLIAGYDFMQDGLEAVEPRLAELLPPEAQTRFVGSDWRAEQLHRALFDGRPDLFYFALHATHYYAETPNNGVLMAQDVAISQADLSGMLVLGLACHAGLNAPGPDHPRPMDFPEAWLRHGASFVGSPGWAFGGDRQTPELRYQEQLMAGFMARLLDDGGAKVGQALVQAKREYLAALTEQTAWHAKTLGGTVLYGLPMTEVRVSVKVHGSVAR